MKRSDTLYFILLQPLCFESKISLSPLGGYDFVS